MAHPSWRLAITLTPWSKMSHNHNALPQIIWVGVLLCFLCFVISTIVDAHIDASSLFTYHFPEQREGIMGPSSCQAHVRRDLLFGKIS